MRCRSKCRYRRGEIYPLLCICSILAFRASRWDGCTETFLSFPTLTVMICTSSVVHRKRGGMSILSSLGIFSVVRGLCVSDRTWPSLVTVSADIATRLRTTTASCLRTSRTHQKMPGQSSRTSIGGRGNHEGAC